MTTKISDIRPSFVRFHKLDVGETFVEKGTLYMKVNSPSSGYNTVRLATGTLIIMPVDVDVEPCDINIEVVK